MLYFIFGIDGYSVRKTVEKLASDFVISEGSDFNLIKLAGDDLKAGRFFDAVLPQPFLGAKRLVVVHNFLTLGDKEAKKVVAEKLKNIPAYSDVVFAEEGEPDKREAIYKALLKTAKVTQFATPTPYAVTDFIKKMVAEAGLKISSATANQLAIAIGPDFSSAENETNKAISYTQYLGRDEIKADVISELVEAVSNLKIFDLTDALAGRNLGAALKILAKMRQKGEDEAMIFNMMIYQLRSMLIVESLGTNVGQAGLHPFVVRKIQASLRKFKTGELVKFYSDLAELDWQIKSGILEFGAAIDLLAAHFCKG